ncbi:MAG: anthranilate synthase component I, partial [Burkholderiales bacterium]
MTESEFKALASQGFNRVPLVLETFADLDTPLSVYLKLANRPYTYLLESVVGGERFGRYSFIGLAAENRIEVRGRKLSEFRNGKLAQTEEVANPLQNIKTLLKRYQAARLPGLPRFCGGLVGYFGYDTVRYIESKLAETVKPDVLDAPDILLMLSEQFAVVDNLTGKLYLV